MARDQQVLAVWEILARLEIPTGLVGWPLTAPPPEGVRFGLSESYFVGRDSAGHVWPAEIAERARLFRTRTEEIDPAQASRFGAHPPGPVLRALAGDLWREQLSFFLLEQEPPVEAFFVFLPGLREISLRYFGGYSAVQFEGSQDEAARRGAQLLSAYYTHLDEFLAQVWARLPEPRLLAVVSTHGAEAAYGWRRGWNFLSRRPALRGYVKRGPDGVLLLLGEGIAAGAKLRAALGADVTPTLLYGLGFPIARDFDGSILTAAFDTGFLARQPLTLLPSYETFSGPE